MEFDIMQLKIDIIKLVLEYFNYSTPSNNDRIIVRGLIAITQLHEKFRKIFTFSQKIKTSIRDTVLLITTINPLL